MASRRPTICGSPTVLNQTSFLTQFWPVLGLLLTLACALSLNNEKPCDKDRVYPAGLEYVQDAPTKWLGSTQIIYFPSSSPFLGPKPTPPPTYSPLPFQSLLLCLPHLPSPKLAYLLLLFLPHTIHSFPPMSWLPPSWSWYFTLRFSSSIPNCTEKNPVACYRWKWVHWLRQLPSSQQQKLGHKHETTWFEFQEASLFCLVLIR